MSHTETPQREEPEINFIGDIEEEDAPQDVENDAVQELDRIHDALGSMRHEFDSTYGMSGQLPDPSLQGFEQPVMRRQPVSTEPQTLEDLYSIYDVGGDHTLRVVRKHPTKWRGTRVAGWVEDLTSQISMADFADRYGGNTYEVSVRGPSRNNDGSERTLKTITINVPGEPRTAASEESVTMNADGRGFHDRAVEMKKLELDFKERESQRRREDRLREEKKQGIDPSFLKAIEDAANREAGRVQSFTGQLITQLRTDVNKLNRQVDEKDSLIQELREKLMVTQSEAANRWREEESRQVRDLKEHQTREIARLKEDHASTIQRMQQEHERRIEQLTTQNSRELQGLRDTEQRERERLRDDANRREKGLQDDFNRREQMLKEREKMLQEEFARREDMVRRDYEMRFQQLERSSKRDIDIIRSSESTKATLTEQTAQNHIQLMQGEVQRLSQQLASAEAEGAQAREELSRHTNKPLLQQVEETRTIAESLGMFDKAKDPEGEMDWKKVVAKGFGDFFSGGGPAQIAESLTQVRSRNQEAVQAAQQRRMSMQRQNALQAAQQRHAMPPLHITAPPQASMLSQMPQGPQAVPTWDQSSGPPAPGDAPYVPPVPAGMPKPEPAPAYPIDSGPPQPKPKPFFQDNTPVVEPTAPSIVSAPEILKEEDQQPQPQPQPQPQQQPQLQPQPQPQPQPHPQQQPQLPQVDEEMVLRFMQQLDGAISSGMVSPRMFAQGFIEEVGADQTREVLGKLQPDHLVEMVATARHPETGELVAQKSAIITRSGRRFVRELWAQAEALLAEKHPLA